MKLRRSLVAFLMTSTMAVGGCHTVPTAPEWSDSAPPFPAYDATHASVQPAEPVRLVEYTESAAQVPGMHPAPEPVQVLAAVEASGVVPRAIGQVHVDGIAPMAEQLDVDFSSVLAIVAGQNPRVDFADARIREALARWRAARTLWIPSLRAGVSYNKHEGTLQASDGTVLDVSRSALESGLGVHAVGAGSPAVHGVFARFHGADAVYQPRVTGCTTVAREHAFDAVNNDLMLEAAIAYLALLRSIQLEAIMQETLDHAEMLASLTESFSSTGQGAQADADRAAVELAFRQNERSRADEETQVASARLSELLHSDPSTALIPTEPALVPIELVSPEMDAAELVSTGLTERPELAESQSLVCAAVHRLERERHAPLIPSLILGVSTGRFGGGTGGTIDNFRNRLDIDAGAFWELRNFGWGERFARDEAGSVVDQARARQIQMMDLVAREVTEAHVRVVARKRQMATAEKAVQAASLSYERNWNRIREGQGLPIETLQSIQALDMAQREYVRTVSDYNESQFRLHRALGWPIQ